MLHFDFSSLSAIYFADPAHGLSSSELQYLDTHFDRYKTHISQLNQGSIDYPSTSAETVQKILDFSQKVQGKYRQIVILGIGGSMLGPKCLLDALTSPLEQKMQVFPVDNIDPYQIANIHAQLKYNTTLFLVQTKSGTTPETIAQYLYFRNQVEKANLNPANHFVFVTDAEKGYLRQISHNEAIPTFEIPETIGGRFSVLTPVGLLVASLTGINIKKLLQGATDAAETYFLESKPDKDVFHLAISQYALHRKQKPNVVIMPYSSRLKTLSEWYVQLLSESTGKEVDREGKIVNAGLTPIAAVGATDQHSQLQLFKEGPNDKQFLFIQVQNHQANIKIPGHAIKNHPNLSYIGGTTFEQLLEAEFQGTRQSLTESLRPNVTLTIEKVDEYHLGALFMILELSVAFLGELLNIGVFNQPGVERSKVLTKEILQNLLP
jgi:glucose-6-phosphate isomerase